MSSFKKKGARKSGGSDKAWSAKGDTLLSSRKLLCEYLSVSAFDDGQPRETSTLMLFVEDGFLKACLSDREEGCVAFFSGDSLEGLLESVEGALQDGSADWRMSRKKRR